MLGGSQTWADMSISLERDNRLPSSVFKKSSKHPTEGDVAAALLPALPWPPPWPHPLPGDASLPLLWAAPRLGPEVGGALLDPLSTEKKSTHSGRVPSALQNSGLDPHSTPGGS